jgi:hypothetical protein
MDATLLIILINGAGNYSANCLYFADNFYRFVQIAKIIDGNDET